MRYRNLEERLIANSIPVHRGHTIDGVPSECWEWIGNRDHHGYGRVTLRVNGKHKKVRAHRVAAQELAGIKFDDERDTWEHECRNTCCIHPNHGKPLPNAVNAGGRSNGRRFE
jgi:hypothetical protein